MQYSSQSFRVMDGRPSAQNQFLCPIPRRTSSNLSGAIGRRRRDCDAGHVQRGDERCPVRSRGDRERQGGRWGEGKGDRREHGCLTFTKSDGGGDGSSTRGGGSNAPDVNSLFLSMTSHVGLPLPAPISGSSGALLGAGAVTMPAAAGADFDA